MSDDQESKIEQRRLRWTCKGCVWRGMDGNVQDGCTLGVLPKYREQGVELSLREHEDGNFYVDAYDRRCLMGRTEEWVERQTESTFEGLARIARNESTLKFTGIVYGKPAREDWEDVGRSLESLAGVESVSHRILVVDFDCQYIDDAITHLMYGRGRWDLIRLEPWISMEHQNDYRGSSYRFGIDEAVRRCTEGCWYTAACGGYEWNPSLFTKLDRMVVDELEQIACIGPENLRGEGFVVQKAMHDQKIFGGNVDRPIYEKIQRASIDFEQPWFYQNYETFMKDGVLDGR